MTPHQLASIMGGDTVHLSGRVSSPAGVYATGSGEMRISVTIEGAEYTLPASAIVRHEAPLRVDNIVRKRTGVTLTGRILSIHGQWAVIGPVEDDDEPPPWIFAVHELERV